MKYLITLSLLWVMQGCKEKTKQKPEWRIVYESELTVDTKSINCCDIIADTSFKVLCNTLNGTAVIRHKELYLKWREYYGISSRWIYEAASLSSSPFIISDTCKAKKIVNAYINALLAKQAEKAANEKSSKEKRITDSIYNAIHNIKNYKQCQ